MSPPSAVVCPASSMLPYSGRHGATGCAIGGAAKNCPLELVLVSIVVSLRFDRMAAIVRRAVIPAHEGEPSLSRVATPNYGERATQTALPAARAASATSC